MFRILDDFQSFEQLDSEENIEVIEDARHIGVGQKQEKEVVDESWIVDRQKKISILPLLEEKQEVREERGHHHVDEEHVGEPSGHYSKEFAVIGIEFSLRTGPDHNALYGIEDCHNGCDTEIKEDYENLMLPR